MPDHWRDLLGLLPGYDPFRSPGGAWFDAARADRAVEFIEELITHVEGGLARTPFLLQPWQKGYVGNLFGWQKRDEKGRTVRRYRESLLYVPRKNGKSPTAAAIAALIFFTDDEAGQQDYVAAADREQAGMLFRQLKGMVEQEPELASRCRVYGGQAAAGQSRSLVREADGSFLRVISADANSKHGGTSHLILVDELHAQPNRDLVDVLRTSMASANRAQPLILYLTTADFDRPSICNEVHDYACKVRDGIVDDPSFLPAVYEAKPEDDWRSPATWAKANPNLGVSVSEQYLADAVKKADANPAFVNTFKRLHLNMRTGTDTLAIPMEKWDACPHFDPADLAGRVCYGGMDLSTTTDISAMVDLYPLDDGTYAVVPHLYAPKARARERARRDRVPYEAWAAQGHMRLTEGDVIDYEVIRADANARREAADIREVACDRWNATQLMTQLGADGFEVVAFGQGFASMTAPTKELIALVASGRLRHNGHPVLRWMASVFATEEDAAGNLKPSKKKSTDRIDGVVALVMALGRAMLRDGEAGSMYETEGLGVL